MYKDLEVWTIRLPQCRLANGLGQIDQLVATTQGHGLVVQWTIRLTQCRRHRRLEQLHLRMLRNWRLLRSRLVRRHRLSLGPLVTRSLQMLHQGRCGCDFDVIMLQVSEKVSPLFVVSYC